MKDKPMSASDAALRPLRSFEFESPRWWKRSGVSLIGVFAVIALLSGLNPPYPRHRKKAGQTQAVSNGRHIGLALHEFAQEFGRFPDETTVERVRSKYPTDMKLGTGSSNAMFRQLLATGIAQSESIFYAKIAEAKVPDGDFKGEKALEKGECGFSYFSGLKPEGDSSRPVAITPLIPGTDRFDYERFDGKAIILKMDNSVTSLNIIKSTGRVKLNGKDILDPDHPVWAGEKWRLVRPE
jgi:hypothetical protein